MERPACYYKRTVKYVDKDGNIRICHTRQKHYLKRKIYSETEQEEIIECYKNCKSMTKALDILNEKYPQLKRYTLRNMIYGKYNCAYGTYEKNDI